MPKLARHDSKTTISTASQMSFAVAACAFAAAGIGSIVNFWLTGWMAVGGMVGVGLFYLALGLVNLNSRNSYDDEQFMSSLSEKTARSDNLYAEAVQHPASVDHKTISMKSKQVIQDD